MQRYQIPGNPIFIPEARLESAAYNALCAHGEARAFGFCPSGIDNLRLPSKEDDPKPELMQAYELLESIGDLLPQAQSRGMTRGMVMHATNPRPNADGCTRRILV